MTSVLCCCKITEPAEVCLCLS